MNGARCAHSLLVLALVLVLSPAAVVAEMPPLLAELVNTLGFDKDDIEEIGDDVLVRELDVDDRSRRAAFAGIARIQTDGSGLTRDASPDEVAGKASGADDFGSFHDPAIPEDVARLRFADDEMEVLADCHVQKCKFKLSRQGIEELSAIDWAQDGAGNEFAELFRKEALGYVERYRKDGSEALIVYEDKSTPVPLAATIDSIVNRFPSFRRHAPVFSEYLLTYPEGRRPSMSDSLMWSIKQFGYRPTLLISHIVIDREPEAAGAVMLVASKTIYANHYLGGRVHMGALVDGQIAFGIPGNFLLFVDRIEFDGALNRFKRSLLGRALRSDTESRMARLRDLADGAP